MHQNFAYGVRKLRRELLAKNDAHIICGVQYVASPPGTWIVLASNSLAVGKQLAIPTAFVQPKKTIHPPRLTGLSCNFGNLDFAD